MNLRDRISLCWRILRAKPGNLLGHAERELPKSDGGTMQAAINADVREILLVFSTQGHSGFSAAYMRGALQALLAFQPLGPLTGEPSEWVEVGDGVHQNRRCGRVFKDRSRFDGQAYDIEAVVFEDPDGSRYTCAESAQPIVFPYTPATAYAPRPTVA